MHDNNLNSCNPAVDFSNEPVKTVSDSRTQSSKILFNSDINGYGRLYGGQLLMWIDELAGIVARRHCGCTVTTASIDNLEFLLPSYLNDILVLDGYITHIGSSSMEIRVDTYAEKTDGSKTLINKAYLNLVALDEHEQPIRVPRLKLLTADEQAEWDNAEKRIKLRKERAASGY